MAKQKSRNIEMPKRDILEGLEHDKVRKHISPENKEKLTNLLKEIQEFLQNGRVEFNAVVDKITVIRERIDLLIKNLPEGSDAAISTLRALDSEILELARQKEEIFAKLKEHAQGLQQGAGGTAKPAFEVPAGIADDLLEGFDMAKVPQPEVLAPPADIATASPTAETTVPAEPAEGPSVVTDDEFVFAFLKANNWRLSRNAETGKVTVVDGKGKEMTVNKVSRAVGDFNDPLAHKLKLVDKKARQTHFVKIIRGLDSPVTLSPEKEKLEPTKEPEPETKPAEVPVKEKAAEARHVKIPTTASATASSRAAKSVVTPKKRSAESEEKAGVDKRDRRSLPELVSPEVFATLPLLRQKEVLEWLENVPWEKVSSKEKFEAIRDLYYTKGLSEETEKIVEEWMQRLSRNHILQLKDRALALEQKNETVGEDEYDYKNNLKEEWYGILNELIEISFMAPVPVAKDAIFTLQELNSDSLITVEDLLQDLIDDKRTEKKDRIEAQQLLEFLDRLKKGKDQSKKTEPLPRVVVQKEQTITSEEQFIVRFEPAVFDTLPESEQREVLESLSFHVKSKRERFFILERLFRASAYTKREINRDIRQAFIQSARDRIAEVRMEAAKLFYKGDIRKKPELFANEEVADYREMMSALHDMALTVSPPDIAKEAILAIGYIGRIEDLIAIEGELRLILSSSEKKKHGVGNINKTLEIIDTQKEHLAGPGGVERQAAPFSGDAIAQSFFTSQDWRVSQGEDGSVLVVDEMYGGVGAREIEDAIVTFWLQNQGNLNMTLEEFKAHFSAVLPKKVQETPSLVQRESVPPPPLPDAGRQPLNIDTIEFRLKEFTPERIDAMEPTEENRQKLVAFLQEFKANTEPLVTSSKSAASSQIDYIDRALSSVLIDKQTYKPENDEQLLAYALNKLPLQEEYIAVEVLYSFRDERKPHLLEETIRRLRLESGDANKPNALLEKARQLLREIKPDSTVLRETDNTQEIPLSAIISEEHAKSEDEKPKWWERLLGRKKKRNDTLYSPFKGDAQAFAAAQQQRDALVDAFSGKEKTKKSQSVPQEQKPISVAQETQKRQENKPVPVSKPPSRAKQKLKMFVGGTAVVGALGGTGYAAKKTYDFVEPILSAQTRQANTPDSSRMTVVTGTPTNTIERPEIVVRSIDPGPRPDLNILYLYDQSEKTELGTKERVLKSMTPRWTEAQQGVRDIMTQSVIELATNTFTSSIATEVVKHKLPSECTSVILANVIVTAEEKARKKFDDSHTPRTPSMVEEEVKKILQTGAPQAWIREDIESFVRLNKDYYGSVPALVMVRQFETDDVYNKAPGNAIFYFNPYRISSAEKVPHMIAKAGAGLDVKKTWLDQKISDNEVDNARLAFDRGLRRLAAATWLPK